MDIQEQGEEKEVKMDLDFVTCNTDMIYDLLEEYGILQCDIDKSLITDMVQKEQISEKIANIVVTLHKKWIRGKDDIPPLSLKKFKETFFSTPAIIDRYQLMFDIPRFLKQHRFSAYLGTMSNLEDESKASSHSRYRGLSNNVKGLKKRMCTNEEKCLIFISMYRDCVNQQDITECLIIFSNVELLSFEDFQNILKPQPFFAFFVWEEITNAQDLCNYFELSFFSRYKEYYLDPSSGDHKHMYSQPHNFFK